MRTLHDYQGLIEQALSQIDLQGKPSQLYEPIRYILGLGGKRLRPTLVLAACDFCQGDISQAYGPAMGLELFHNFTLLHDDIMDKAPLRRGATTVHEKWDVNRAILSGDTMFAIAGKLMLDTHPDAVKTIQSLFFQTAIEVCEGQQLDMDFESREDVCTDEYIEMIGLKTAVLLAACLKTGALAAKAPEEVLHSLYQFGFHCGIAFQLQDDYLDVYGDEVSFGKTAGGDITSNKKTWLYLKALETADPMTRSRLLTLYSSQLGSHTEKVEDVRNIFTDLGIPSLIKNLMEEYHHRALDHLHHAETIFGSSSVLEAFAAKMIHRNS